MDIAVAGHHQRPFNRLHIVHRGDDELRVRNQAIFHHIAVNQRAARGFHQSVANPIPGGIAHFGITVFQVIRQQFNRALHGVNQLNAAAQVKAQNRVRGVAEAGPKTFQVAVRQRGLEGAGDVDARQAVRAQDMPLVAGLPGVRILGLREFDAFLKLLGGKVFLFLAVRA